MPSLPQTSAACRPLLLSLVSLFSVLLFLGSSVVGGASLREPRLHGSEPNSPRGAFYQTPNADMLRALQYIQSLHQQQRAPLVAVSEDAEKLRAMLRLGSNPVQNNNRGEEEEEEEEEEEGEDKSEELLQAVLSTLQQTEKSSKPTRLHTEAAKDSRGQQRQLAILPHRKLPLMFEDEEEEEGERGEDEDEDEGPEREIPLKRTNENVEEKYTPQNLATLQSVFDELDKLTSTKTLRKRQEEEEDGEEDDDEDAFNLRNVAYDDIGGELMNWGPMDEPEEEEEEEEEDKHEADRGLDYVDDNDEEAEDEEDEGERYPAKRSKDPDDMANLVDYYLLKVLEKTEEEEQKRELEKEEEEEEEEEEKRAVQSVDPRLIYQLIQISQRYQIPPEDLLDMLRTGEKSSQSTLRKSSQISNKFPAMTHKKIPHATFSSGRTPPYALKTPQQLRTEHILKVLGLTEEPAPAWRQRHYKSPPSTLRAGRPGNFAPTPRRPLKNPSMSNDYDDTLGEDELAAYLAAQMLARYPKPAAYSSYKASQKREEEAGQENTAGLFEKPAEDYFDRMDDDKSEKRQTAEEGEEERDGENEAVMKLLSFLNPETDQSDAKAAKGV